MKRSALSLIGSLVGMIYVAYLCLELVYSKNLREFEFSAAGFSMRAAVLLPCALMAGTAVLLGWIGFAARKRGPVLAAALLYLATAPLVAGMFAVPLAFSLLLLADYFASLVRKRREDAAKAPPDPAPETESASGNAETDDPDEGDPMEDDVGDALDDDFDDDADESPEDDPSDDIEADLLGGDSGDDLRLEALLEDEGGSDDETRPRTDGMAVFLGVFMGLAALALIGMVVYGVMGYKLPFMP